MGYDVGSGPRTVIMVALADTGVEVRHV